MAGKYITHLLHLLVTGKTHHKNMMSLECFVQVHITKALIEEGEQTLEHL